MLAWVALLMIIVFLGACGVVIGASCYQIVNVIRRTPRKPKPVMKAIRT